MANDRHTQDNLMHLIAIVINDTSAFVKLFLLISSISSTVMEVNCYDFQLAVN